MRGKRPQPLHDTFRVRIIPARAGQTNSNSMWQREYADHPRACGANSSLRDEEPADTRIIPARAGQTVLFCPQFVHLPDHPRACGANADIGVSTWGMIGSSPRVRGKPNKLRGLKNFTRIIPARAGQTLPLVNTMAGWSDHPRACGANSQRSARKNVDCGSSPRVRGKQSDFMRKLLSAGPSIIGFAQWLQSSCYCSCFQSSAKTPISRGTTPTSLFLGFQNSITLLLLT